MSDNQEKTYTIMLVDDNSVNLNNGKSVLSEKYDVFTASSGEKALNLLRKLTPDLLLLDIDMPEMNGYEVLQRIKGSGDIKSDFAVIFLTAHADVENELYGLSLGAVDYITKPFSPQLLHKRIEMHLKYQDYTRDLNKAVAQKAKAISELQDSLLHGFAELVENRDSVTGGHIIRTQNYLKILIEGIIASGLFSEQIKNWNIEQLIQSAQLHDVGKIKISDFLLKKPTKLEPLDYEEIKKHAEAGAQIIENIAGSVSEKEFLKSAAVFALTHHERWDGNGYPYQLAAEQIPLEGRIMAIADVYDALVSERPYKPPFSHDKAVQIILEGKGTQFDPALIEIFQAVAEKFRLASEKK